MSDAKTFSPPVTATTKRSRRIPIIWLLPLLAVAIGIWLAWDTYSKRGPTITVSFTSAEGLTAGQSQLKFKDIVFGTVQSLDLTPDQSRVVATISTTNRATPLLTKGTVFWVAKPRLFAGNVTGLETLVSGGYVAMLPEAHGVEAQRSFVGVEEPPLLTANTPGRTFTLKATRLGSVDLGSPVFFRDFTVGQVLGWTMADDAESVAIRVFVRAPYDQFVHEETRFWNASGISVKLGSSGVDVQLESLRALLLGGLAFDTPPNVKSTVAQQDHTFPLYANREVANAASYRRKVPLLSYFGGSVRGLGPGSDVTVHGLKVGEVTDVRLTYDPVKDAVLAPVQFEVDPERVIGIGKQAYATPAEGVAALIKGGWRTTLETVSLITGQQAVALEVIPDATPGEMKIEDGHFVMPSVESGGFASLSSSATDLLKSVGQIPFKQIGASLDEILRNTNEATSGPEMKRALADLAVTLARTKGLMGDLQSGAGPALAQLPQLTAGLQKTLGSLDMLMASLNKGYGNDTKFNRDVERLLVQLSDAVRSMRSLADLLARHPEALISGRPAAGAE